MIVFTQAETEGDFQGILQLQKRNLLTNLTPGEAASQGFVTVVHTLEQLSSLNAQEKHVVAKEGDRIIAYVLAMTPASRSDIPVLIPMFDLFNELFYNGRPIAEQDYIVVGQVCIDKSYRGKGLFDQCYAAYKEQYSTRYSFAITEIATGNTRSLKAHKRLGFEKLTTYGAPDGVDWEVVAWNWRKR